MTFILRPETQLEDLRAKLAEASGRPAYITAGQMVASNCRYRWPGSNDYKAASQWDVFNSVLTTSDCLRREHVTGTSHEDLFYFDLVPSPFIRVVIPSLSGDKLDQVRGWYKTAGLPLSPYGSGDLFVKSTEAEVPAELRAFYLDKRKIRGPHFVSGVAFHLSDYIENPQIIREHWAIDGVLMDKNGQHQAIMVPRGQYHGKTHTLLQNFNYYNIVDRDPGPCIVCAGRSGERIHLSGMAHGAEAAYPTGLICRGCTKDTFTAWQQLLDQGIPNL